MVDEEVTASNSELARTTAWVAWASWVGLAGGALDTADGEQLPHRSRPSPNPNPRAVVSQTGMVPGYLMRAKLTPGLIENISQKDSPKTGQDIRGASKCAA